MHLLRGLGRRAGRIGDRPALCLGSPGNLRRRDTCGGDTGITAGRQQVSRVRLVSRGIVYGVADLCNTIRPGSTTSKEARHGRAREGRVIVYDRLEGSSLCRCARQHIVDGSHRACDRELLVSKRGIYGTCQNGDQEVFCHRSEPVHHNLLCLSYPFQPQIEIYRTTGSQPLGSDDTAQIRP